MKPNSTPRVKKKHGHYCEWKEDGFWDYYMPECSPNNQLPINFNRRKYTFCPYCGKTIKERKFMNDEPKPVMHDEITPHMQILTYLNQQFPATQGHIKLTEMLAACQFQLTAVTLDRDNAVVMLKDAMAERNQLRDICEYAWSILANAGGGNWELETADWQMAVKKWRGQYFEHLDKYLEKKSDPSLQQLSPSSSEEKK